MNYEWKRISPDNEPSGNWKYRRVPCDPIRDIDEFIKQVSAHQTTMPDCFIDLETGELVTAENIGEWQRRKMSEDLISALTDDELVDIHNRLAEIRDPDDPLVIELKDELRRRG